VTDQDTDRFGIVITGLAEVFGESLSDPRIEAYFQALEDLPIESIERAAKILLGSSRFFPKPVEIREAIAGTPTDRADSAWRIFVKLCVEEGHYPSLYVTDGPMAFAIEHLGGWIEAQAKLGDASPEMARAYEKQFIASYRLGEKRQTPPTYLVGQIEAGNRQGGAMERAKGAMIQITVCTVGNADYQRLSMPFDLRTRALTGDSLKALEAGEIQRYLPAPFRIPVALLPPADDEIAKPEDMALVKRYVENFVARIAGRRIQGEVAPEDMAAFENQEAAQ
jgi:hypothetical protein